MKADFEKGTKICSKCKRELPISEFNKDKSRVDGLQNYCKGCNIVRIKKYYEDNKENIIAYRKLYYEDNKKYILERNAKYRKTEKGKQILRQAKKKYNNSEKGKQTSKKYMDKYSNTFGRDGCKRGCSGMLKRDYELTEQEIMRRNVKRKQNKCKTKMTNPHGVLILYDGRLDNLSTQEYKRMQHAEYNRQKRCAIRGYVGRVKPSEHFLFDFDLEQMLKDKVYYGNKKNNIQITKWWQGTIRHWTVNDGIWKK